MDGGGENFFTIFFFSTFLADLWRITYFMELFSFPFFVFCALTKRVVICLVFKWENGVLTDQILAACKQEAMRLNLIEIFLARQRKSKNILPRPHLIIS